MIGWAQIVRGPGTPESTVWHYSGCFVERSWHSATQLYGIKGCVIFETTPLPCLDLIGVI